MKAPSAPAAAPDSRLPPWNEVIPRASQQEQDPSLTPFITPWQISPTESPFCRPRSPSVRPTTQRACKTPRQCLWQDPLARSSPWSCKRVFTTSRGLVNTQAASRREHPGRSPEVARQLEEAARGRTHHGVRRTQWMPFCGEVGQQTQTVLGRLAAAEHWSSLRGGFEEFVL